MKKLTNTAHHISSRIGKAIGDYNLIEEGDKILVAVSGGKDSLTLLELLKARQKWSPVKFDLFAAHIRTDFSCSACTHTEKLKKFFTDLGIEYVFKKISVLGKNKTTSCFWCSWNRRKALFEIADSLGCTKVALGHHKDDIIETTLLNLFFQGEFSSMNPRQELFKGKIIIIRPLCYVEEKMTNLFAKEHNFPSQLCKCPNSQDSNRKYMKKLIYDLEKRSPDVKTNLFNSLSRVKHDYLKIKEDTMSLKGKSNATRKNHK